MNLIFFSRRKGRARHLNLAHPATLALLGVGVVGLLTSIFWLGVKVGVNRATMAGGQTEIAQQRSELALMRQRLQERVDGLAIRLGTLNAHLVRLNALGKRVAQVANLNTAEFDFDHDPAVGGPESDARGKGAEIPDLTAMINQYDRQLDFRAAQFSALETVLLGRELSAEVRPTGKPIANGYLSSGFGARMDPFNGEEAFHKGEDFAGSAGEDVLSVAQGVVTFAGAREGYGNMVEINHGNGYVTRYAHASRVLVAPGDTVQRGQAVAIVGSTGRSTGPHVHFEVLKDGVAIDPALYSGS